MKKFDWPRFFEWLCQWGIALFGYAMAGSFLLFLIIPIWIKFWETIEKFWGVELFP